MTLLHVLPHQELCPEGATIDADPGTSICDALLDVGINIDHACEKSCACTTCHVVIRAGFNALSPADEKEEDMLDKACAIQLKAQAGGTPLVTPPAAVLAHTARQLISDDVPEGEREWPALLRLLDQTDHSYRN